jgi:hypothetical protein
MNTELEIRVINKFIINDKKDRYIGFISSNKQRNKFIKILPHFKDFNFELLESMNGNEHQFVLSKLQTLKVDTSNCYIISENRLFDTKVVETPTALSQIIGYGMGTIIVFGEADMIYYEGEEPKNRFISK